MNKIQKDLYEYLGEIYCSAIKNMNCSSDLPSLEYYRGQAIMINMIMEHYGFVDDDDNKCLRNERQNICKNVRTTWLSCKKDNIKNEN